MTKNLELLKLILPNLLFEYFDLVKQETTTKTIHLYFEELNDPSFVQGNVKVHSKGFYEEATVQDFPIRGKSVYLHIRRRKWMNIETKEILFRDWDMVAKGTRMTSEFAAFLKGIHLNIND
jgi:hypothetical protein